MTPAPTRRAPGRPRKGAQRTRPTFTPDPNATGRPAVIYARLSDDDKKDDGNSLSVDMQISDCRKLCEQAGYRIVDICFDDGISGRTYPTGAEYDLDANTDKITQHEIRRHTHKRRPGLGKAMSYIINGDAEVLVCREMTRFARPVSGSKLPYSLQNFFRLNASRAGMHTQNGYIDFSDDMKIMMIIIEDCIEDKKVRERKRAAMDSRNALAEEGLYFGPRAPYGYMDISKQKRRMLLVPDPATAPIVEEIFKRALEGKRIQGGKEIEGESVMSISEYLNSKKIPTPKHNDKKHPTDNWTGATIKAIVTNSIYAGYRQINDDFMDGNGEGEYVRRTRVQSTLTENVRFVKSPSVEKPIISFNTFNDVRNMFISRKRQPRNTGTTQNLTAGLLRCGECGYTLGLVKATTGENHSYRCNRRIDLHCKNAINAGNLDRFLENFLPMRYIIEVKQHHDAAKEKEIRGPVLEREIAEINAKIARTKAAYAKMPANMDVTPILEEVAKEQRKLKEKTAELERLKKVAPIDSTNYATVLKAPKELEAKREALRIIFEEIEIFPDYVNFVFSSGENLKVKRNSTSATKRGRWLPQVRGVPKGDNITLEIDAIALDFENSKKYFDGKLIIEADRNFEKDDYVLDLENKHH